MQQVQADPAPTTSQSTTLPPALLAQAAQRLRVWALLYAFVFFMVAIMPVFILPEERADFLASAWRWFPPVCSIVVALLVAMAASRPSLAGHAVIRLGLAFQVAGSYGIAAAEYLEPSSSHVMSPLGGLSWVSVWMLSFAVTVPSPPA